jgi:hypothetical protein
MREYTGGLYKITIEIVDGGFVRYNRYKRYGAVWRFKEGFYECCKYTSAPIRFAFKQVEYYEIFYDTFFRTQ